jgi:choline-phosphate cytidylyltransferase
LAKSGIVGKIVSVDATCTSLRDKGLEEESDDSRTWNSISAWGPTALLPIFQLLGTQYSKKEIVTHLTNDKNKYDAFTKIDIVYPDSVASIKVGKGVKSEGELIVSGTNGYIYVPAPWWKTDYFEIRYENPNNNKRYFYQLDGEGIRYEIVSFVRAITTGKDNSYVEKSVSEEIIRIIEDFNCEKDLIKI